MARSNSKQRLFEVMGKTDNTFKPKLNESGDEAFYAMQDTEVVFYDVLVWDEHARNGKAVSDVREAMKLATELFYRYNNSFELVLRGINKQNYIVETEVIFRLDYDKIRDAEEKLKAKPKPEKQDSVNEISADMAYRAHDAATRKEIDSFNSPYHSKEEHEKAKKQAEKFWYYGQGKDNEENPEPPITEKMIGKKPKGKRDDVSYYKGAGIFPGYTHFAVIKADTPTSDGGMLKTANKIVNAWDYRGYDSDDLKADKQWYFTGDIKDMDISPKLVQIVTAPYLKKRGVDPYDQNNWMKTEEMIAWMKTQY